MHANDDGDLTLLVTIL